LVQYRRDFTPGATYFFTIALKNRRSSYLLDYIDTLKDALRVVRHQAPFITHAIVILPEHFMLYGSFLLGMMITHVDGV